LGVAHIVDQQKEHLPRYVKELTGGKGVNKVFECSGIVQALNTGMQIAAKKADVVQLGIFKEQFNMIDTSLFFSREIRLVGSRTQKPSSWMISLDLMRRGAVCPEKIVTGIVSLDDWREGFKRIQNCTDVKIVIQM